MFHNTFDKSMMIFHNISHSNPRVKAAKESISTHTYNICCWHCWPGRSILMGSGGVQLALTHWGQVTYICISDLTSIGSDNGLSPGQRQAIIRTNAGILLIRPLGANFSEILIAILIFSFKKMCLKVSSKKRRPFCLGLNELTHWSMGDVAEILH